MNRKITKYEQFLCLQMFGTLYLTETTGTQIVIQRVPGGYMWREWSKEQGNVDGFNSVFVKWDYFFLDMDPLNYQTYYLIAENNYSILRHSEGVHAGDTKNIYDTQRRQITGITKADIINNYIIIATYENGKLTFNGELE